MSTTTTETNERLVGMLIEAFNEQDLTALLELYTEDAVVHGAREEYEGVEGIERFAHNQIKRFPDVTITGEDLLATEDWATARFTLAGTQDGPFLGVKPTGRAVEISGIAIVRVEDGKIVEMWIEADQLGAMYQLGAIDSPSE